MIDDLGRWTAVLSLSGYRSAKRKAKFFLSVKHRIDDLWQDYHARLEQEGPIDWRTYMYSGGPFSGKPVDQVAGELGLLAPKESPLHHPFEIYKDRSNG